MKWVFGVLLILNVAVWLWPSDGQRNAEGAGSGQASGAGLARARSGDPPVNPKDLILLGEKGSVIGSGWSPDGEASPPVTPVTTVARAGALPDVQSDIDPEDLAVDPPLQNKTETRALNAERRCLRIGPFFTNNAKTAAREFVASFEVPVDTQVVDGRTVRSWRSYLGPFDSASEARAASDRAREAGFENLRQVPQADGKAMVSLGLFSTEKSAYRLHNQSRFSTLPIKIREERTRLPSTNWLKVPAPGVTIYELRMIERVDWGESQVNVREIICTG